MCAHACRKILKHLLHFLGSGSGIGAARASLRRIMDTAGTVERWDQATRAQLGAALLHELLEVAKIGAPPSHKDSYAGFDRKVLEFSEEKLKHLPDSGSASLDSRSLPSGSSEVDDWEERGMVFVPAFKHGTVPVGSEFCLSARLLVCLLRCCGLSLADSFFKHKHSQCWSLLKHLHENTI